MELLERNKEEGLKTTTLTGIPGKLNIRHLDNREQYINHLEDLLLLYTSTIKELNYMLGE